MTAPRNIPSPPDQLFCQSCGEPVVLPGFVRWGGWEFNEFRANARAGEVTIKLRGLSARLLLRLASARGSFVSRTSLYDSLYELVPEAKRPKSTKIIEVTVCYARKDLRVAGFEKAVASEYGHGWRLLPVIEACG